MAVRATGLAVLIVMLVHVPFFLITLATGEELEGSLHDVAIIATFGAIVTAGVISGFVAGRFASSSHPTRRTATVASVTLMTASVGLTLVLLDLASGADVDGWLITSTFIVTGVSIVLGALVGYMAGRERRLGRERSALERST